MVVLVAGYLVHVLWRIWLSRHLVAPAAHADEDGYLIAARALAGGPGGGTTENPAFRRLGYPFLLQPVYWFTSDAFVVYRGALATNALINALVFPLLFLCGRRIFALSRPLAVGAAFAVASVPAVVFYSEFALTDAVLATIGLTWLLFAHHWLAAVTPRARLWGAIGSGVAAGLFYAVHVRGTVVVFAHLLFVAAALLLRRFPLRAAVASVLAVAVAAALDPALKLAIRGAISTWGRSPKSQTIEAFTTLRGAARMLEGADGQLWYFGVATLGLGMIGLVSVLAPLFQVGEPRRLLADRVEGARWIVMAATLVMTLLIALSSSAALPPTDNRVNYFAYPRYIHFLFPIWIIAGLYAVRRATPKGLLLLAGTGLAATCLAGVVVLARLQGAGPLSFEPFDAPEIAFLGWRWTAIGIVRPTLMAVALGALLVVLLRRPGTAAARAVLVAVLVLNGVAMHVVTLRISEPMVVGQYLADTPRLVRDAGLRPGDRVAFATRQPTWYLLYNHTREVYWVRLQLFDQLTTEPPADTNVVIAPWQAPDPKLNWDGESRGFRLLASDPKHHWAVWRRG